MDFSAFQQLHQAVAFADFGNGGYIHPGVEQCPGCALGGIEGKAAFVEFSGGVHHFPFVAVADGDENAAAFFHAIVRRDQAFIEGFHQGAADAENFPGGFHFRPKLGIETGKLFKGEYRYFYGKVGYRAVKAGAVAHILELFSQHGPGGDIHHRQARDLGNVRHGTGGPGVGFDNVDFIGVDYVLDIQKPHGFQALGNLFRGGNELFRQRSGKVKGGICRNGIPGVHPGPFDMLHDAGDQDILAIGNDINFYFNAHEVGVDEYGVFNALGENDAHIFFDILIVKGNDHILAPQYVGGTEQHRIAQALCSGNGFLGGHHRFPFGAFDAVLFQNFIKAFSVFGNVNAVGLGAEDMFSPGIEVFCQLNGSLSAKGHYHAIGFFRVEDIADILRCKGFKIEAVGGVEVGGNGFRVVIDQHHFVAGFLQRPYAVNRGIVKLNALTDADGAGAENNDALFAGSVFGNEFFGFVFFIEGAVKVGGLCGKFPGAGIHHFINGSGRCGNLLTGKGFDGFIEEAVFLCRPIEAFR